MKITYNWNDIHTRGELIIIKYFVWRLEWSLLFQRKWYYVNMVHAQLKFKKDTLIFLRAKNIFKSCYTWTLSVLKSDFVWPRALSSENKKAKFIRLFASLLTSTLHVYRLRVVNRIYIMRVYSLYGMIFVDITRLSVLIESDKQDLFIIETENMSIQCRVDNKHCFSYNCATFFAPAWSRMWSGY